MSTPFGSIRIDLLWGSYSILESCTLLQPPKSANDHQLSMPKSLLVTSVTFVWPASTNIEPENSPDHFPLQNQYVLWFHVNVQGSSLRELALPV